MNSSFLRPFFFLGALAATALLQPAASAQEIAPLEIRGEQFVTAAGTPVRFWGTNLVAFYPTHEVADKFAANLAERQFNLVRPHHMLRPSSDWVQAAAPIVALQSYRDGMTRVPDKEAWDRFDYLNSALRKNGIYLMLAVWWTRNYAPGDVDVLKTDDADRKAWMNAISELNSWDWRKGFDVRKMLCSVDDRVAALEEEFARQLLTHQNPYTRLRYADDPQVLTLELMNEASTEYAIICGNRFPDYFQKKLIAKWEAFAKAEGIEPGDLYKPADRKVVQVRARFLRKLDEDFLLRMKQLVRSTGSNAAVTFSNLWRGEATLQMHAQSADYIEDHMYGDPMVVSKPDDFVLALSKTPLAGKPFIVGELNQAEGDKNILAQSPTRTMLPLAASAYGSLQGWSGITFFAWVHGDKHVGADGWADTESNDPLPPAGEVRRFSGSMICDGMQLDHLRTCGMIFRRGLLSASTSPITLHVDEPLFVGDYNGLMRGKYTIKPGWQDIHKIRKTFGPAPATQATALWLTQAPPDPMISDTREITKDTQRKQLTAVAPQVEAFSGWLDGKAPASLKHLQISGDGFATVIMVAADDAPIPSSRKLVISRSHLSHDNAALPGPELRLTGLAVPTGNQKWLLTPTRPRGSQAAVQILTMTNGAFTLPESSWHECELELK